MFIFYELWKLAARLRVGIAFGQKVILLLAAGDKSTQKKDILVARKRLARVLIMKEFN